MRKLCVSAVLLAFISVARVQAGMTGDPITSILHTAFSGSWEDNSSAVVGPAVEFTNYYFSDGITLSLDVSDTSFTLSYSSTLGTGFNLGLDGFEFTDPAQTFAGVTLVSSTGGFPTNSITDTTVSAHNIHVTMDEPQLPGGASWTATWNVTFRPALAISKQGTNVVVSWPQDATGYKLQRQTGLNPANWLDVVTATNKATFPATNTVQFFRLMKP